MRYFFTKGSLAGDFWLVYDTKQTHLEGKNEHRGQPEKLYRDQWKAL